MAEITSGSKLARLKTIITRLILVGVVWLLALIVYSDAEISNKFATNRWLVPAKVYARSKPLLEGEATTLKQFTSELKTLNYRQVIKATQPGEYEQYGSDFILYLRGFQFEDGFVPARKVSVRINNESIVKAQLISETDAANALRLEPVFIGRVNPLVSEDRELVTLEKVPATLVDALLVSEDREFFQHMGISLKGIARAFQKNISDGKITQGGSTITQQLVKNYFLTNQRTLWRKAREAIMALTLEWRYSKDEILQAYINEVYLGQDGARAIHGFGKASRFYFDRDISQLNYSQIATLVALVRGPSYYDPRRYPERALKRRDLILEQLHAFGKISEKEWQLAQQKSLQVIPHGRANRSTMPAAMGMVTRQLKQHYSLEQLNHDDLSVFTSINPFVQRAAEQALSQRIDWITQHYPSVPDDLQGALVVSDRFNGDVLAVVGDRDPSFSGFNRAIHAYRQTGSVIKPFVYLAALERASQYSLVTTLQDKAFSLTATDGSLWQPNNYDKQQHGNVSLRKAMINSYNLSTARLALSVGVENIVSNFYRFGFSRQLHAFPSLALGAQEMSPFEVLSLYQVLSSGGLKVETSVISSVVDSTGQLLDRYPITAEQVVTRESVFLTNKLLQAAVREGTGKQIHQRLPGLQLAGKTGTTDDLKDSWFAGFSENYLAVAWLGMDNNQPMHLTGATGALQVWGDLIEQVENQPIIMRQPEGIVYAKSGWFSECVPFVAGYLPDDFDACD